MSDHTTSTPPALAELARQVADQHVEMTSAISDERAAETELLARIVDAVRPALRALGSRIAHRKIGASVGLGSTQSGYSDAETFLLRDYMIEAGAWNDGDADEQTGAPVRGTVVADEIDHESTGTGTRREEGRKLYLLEDGRFLEAAYVDQRTQWQGARSCYAVERWRVLPVDQIPGRWPVDEIAEELRVKLEAQLSGRATKTTAAAQERAERLRAVVALLGGRK